LTKTQLDSSIFLKIVIRIIIVRQLLKTFVRKFDWLSRSYEMVFEKTQPKPLFLRKKNPTFALAFK